MKKKKNSANGAETVHVPLATADDFIRDIEQDFEPATRQVLPHLGKAVLLRRPRTRWFFYQQSHYMPQDLANAVAKQAGEMLPEVSEDVRKVMNAASWFICIVRATMLEPRIATGDTPGPGEIHASMIHQDDIMFIVDYATGMKGGASVDLATFRGKRPLRHPSVTSEDGGNMEVPAV